MSTAGKVLVVLILLASLVWVLLTAGVDQLNRNGNQALNTLTERLDKLQVDLKNTQDEIVRSKDQTHVLQELMDREISVINARQNDVQRLASDVTENLSRVRYELETVQHTLQSAEQDRTQRAAEAVAEQTALDAAKAEFLALKATDGQLRERLALLRNRVQEDPQIQRRHPASEREVNSQPPGLISFPFFQSVSRTTVLLGPRSSSCRQAGIPREWGAPAGFFWGRGRHRSAIGGA